MDLIIWSSGRSQPARAHADTCAEGVGAAAGDAALVVAATLVGEARRVWPFALVGGLDRAGALVNGTPEDVTAEVRRAADEAGARKLILGAGCVVASARRDENLLAARRAVERAL